MIYCLARRFITRWEATLKPERFRESWVPADNYSQIEDGFAATMNMPENDFATVKETAWLYVIVICLVGFGILLSLYAGRNLKPARFLDGMIVAQEKAHLPQSAATATGDLTAGLRHNATGALGRLFIQLGVILGAAAALGWVFTRFRQPAVVGEMLAGILLGPSLFGLLAPGVFHFVFAPASLEPLRLFSQIGVCFFMFAIGMELNLRQLRHSAHRYLVIGHSSILVPFLAGVLLSFLLYRGYAVRERRLSALCPLYRAPP